MPRTLLVVDDVATNRRILSKILSEDYDILEAANGQEAMSVLIHDYKRISAVLLDLSMPIMDGYEVLRRMHSNAALSLLPVIVMTGDKQEQSEVQALQMGAMDYISKPYSVQIVKQRIHNMINLRETAATVNALQRDKLTGLYNREAFFEKVAPIIKSQMPGHYALSCFDIDNFKVINDQYGSDKGDQVLKHIGRVMRNVFDSTGAIGCRMTADNFALLTPKDQLDTEKFTSAWDSAAAFDGSIPRMTFSIGRYIIDDFSLTPSAMYDRAAIAKASIKGRFDKHLAVYDESMRKEILHEQEIVNEMKQALETEQFEVWFQPQFNHSTGALIGAEALVRWRHPTKGLMPPGRFIPVFERNGFIYELDKYIWARTCEYLRAWLDEGRNPLPISVNISRYDVLRDDFFEYITGLIENYNLSVDLLRLEVTESAFAKSTEQIIYVVKRLINYGFTIEIDDFGSGYSSLNTLKDVPATVLKLDMRFLESSDDSQRGGNILESIVRMAKWLGMSVIAEGVETKEQADYLNSIGCSYIQGYLYSRPIPVSGYENLAKGVGKEEKMLALETVENLDNNSFWDPESMDTLIFNSYIGGACILEYHAEKLEILRANRKYMQVMGCENQSTQEALKVNWFDHMDEKGRKKVLSAITTAKEKGDEVTDEFEFTNLLGRVGVTYLRSTLRVIASSGDRYLVYCTNENITAQREAEKKESESAQRLQVILDNLINAVTATVMTNGRLKFLFASDKLFDILGYSRTEFGHLEDSLNCIHPLDRERVIALKKRSLETGKGYYAEYRLVCKNKNVIWIRNQASITAFEGVSQPVMLSVLSDITEAYELRKREGALSSQLSAIMKNVPGGITAVVHENDKSEIIFANDGFYEMLGYTREQFAVEIGDPFEVIHPDDRGQALSASLECDRENRTVSNVHRCVCRDGSVIWVQCSMSMAEMAMDDGPRRAQISISGDITRVRELTENLSDVMNDMPGGLIRLMVGDSGVHAVYINEGFCAMLGQSRERLLEEYGDRLMNAVHPDDRAEVESALDSMIKTGKATLPKHRMLRSDGKYIWVGTSGRATKNASGDTFINIYYTDITDRVSDEEKQKELLDNLPCGAALFERDEKGDMSVVHMNKRYLEMMRFKNGREDYVYRSSVHPDDQETLSRAIAFAEKENRDTECDLRLMCGDGVYRHFHLVTRSVKTPDGKTRRYATYTPIRDEELSLKEMLPFVLSTIMTASNDLVFAKDVALRYISVSTGFVKSLGKTDEREILGKTDQEIYEKKYADLYENCDTTVINTGAPVENAILALPPINGQPRFCNVSNYPIKDVSGNIAGIYGMARDITNESEAYSRLKLLTDTIPGGLASYVITCVDDIRITYFTDGLCALFGFTREEYELLANTDAMGRVFDEDLPVIKNKVKRLIENGESIECEYRVHVNGGGYKWIKHRGTLAMCSDDAVVVNAALFDVTQQHEFNQKLYVRDEEYRLAMAQAGQLCYRYDVEKKTIEASPEAVAVFGGETFINNVPDGIIERGTVLDESVDAVRGMFADIDSGVKSGAVTLLRRTSKDETRFFEARFSTVFGEEGKPRSAIILMADVTERREKEAVYSKWQQSFVERDIYSYTLMRYNLTQNEPVSEPKGTLVDLGKFEGFMSFDECMLRYCNAYVHPEDRAMYIDAVDMDALLAGYYRNKRRETIEFREMRPDETSRWLKLTVEMVEYPDTTDIEAYLVYEDIDDSKRAELLTIERAETDPLTGLLNRTVFTSRMQARMNVAKKDASHAFMLLDVDGFKLVNDVFGHGAGDAALIDIATALKGILRSSDLIGRLGGDEFVMFIGDIPNEESAENKARQICSLVRKGFSVDVQISASIGIAFFPRDGAAFDELYKKADCALYHVKTCGKDSFAIYREGMSGRGADVEDELVSAPVTARDTKKRRMLIVDDEVIDRSLLINMFADDFIIEKARNGQSALMQIRHYGSSLSVVLLDIMMPGMDGFEVLRTMQQNPETRSIPVIIVSADKDRQTALDAIKFGASDMVIKPIDPELIRLRVQSAITKSENERLRAQNSYLSLKNNEVVRYRTALECTGAMLIEYDWITGAFIYDPNLSKGVAGNWDKRGLWHILMSDMVAQVKTVKHMQELVHAIADDRTRIDGSLEVELKIPNGEKHTFRFDVHKVLNDFMLTDKLLLLLTDTGE